MCTSLVLGVRVLSRAFRSLVRLVRDKPKEEEDRKRIKLTARDGSSGKGVSPSGAQSSNWGGAPWMSNSDWQGDLWWAGAHAAWGKRSWAAQEWGDSERWWSESWRGSFWEEPAWWGSSGGWTWNEAEDGDVDGEGVWKMIWVPFTVIGGGEAEGRSGHPGVSPEREADGGSREKKNEKATPWTRTPGQSGQGDQRSHRRLVRAQLHNESKNAGTTTGGTGDQGAPPSSSGLVGDSPKGPDAIGQGCPGCRGSNHFAIKCMANPRMCGRCCPKRPEGACAFHKLFAVAVRTPTPPPPPAPAAGSVPTPRASLAPAAAKAAAGTGGPASASPSRSPSRTALV